jgi:hypothetical protein
MRDKAKGQRAGSSLASVCAWLLVACSSPASPPAPATVTLELGTGLTHGDATFEPLSTGGPLVAYQGPQGGFHVFLSVRATGIFPGDATLATSLCKTRNANPCVEFTVTDEDTGRTLDAYPGLRIPFVAVPSQPGVLELPEPRLVVLDIPSLRDVDGHALGVSAVVEDRAGARGDQALTVICQSAASFALDAGAASP